MVRGGELERQVRADARALRRPKRLGFTQLEGLAVNELLEQAGLDPLPTRTPAVE